MFPCTGGPIRDRKRERHHVSAPHAARADTGQEDPRWLQTKAEDD